MSLYDESMSSKYGKPLADPMDEAFGNHYKKNAITIEPKDVLLDMPFALANIFKYLLRLGDKGDSKSDKRKVIEYIKIIKEYACHPHVHSELTYGIFEYSFYEKIDELVLLQKKGTKTLYLNSEIVSRGDTTCFEEWLTGIELTLWEEINC